MTLNRYRLVSNWRGNSEQRRPLTGAERAQLHRARARDETTPMGRPGRRPPRELLAIPASPGVDRGYPLDFLSPMRHVATAVERAGQRGISLADLADTYRHPNTGDISRVIRVHGLRNEHDVNRFLMDRALSAFGAKLRPPTRGYGWRLAVPFDELGVTRNTPD